MRSVIFRCTAVSCALLLTSCSMFKSSQPVLTAVKQKKVIACGFSSLTPEQLHANVPVAERYFPGNGVVLHLNKKVTLEDGTAFEANRHSLFRGIPWQRQWFDDTIEQIRTAPFKKYTDNFVYAATTGCYFDMFDDQAWKVVCNNLGVLAEVAKASGLKGIFFDIEHYTSKSWPLFQYNPDSPHTFNEFQRQARLRGQQMMKAISTRYPDITIIGVLGVYSINYAALSCPEPILQYAQSTYGLSKAFFDGMFDAIPSTAKLYDGTESPGYLAHEIEDYFKISSDFYQNSPRLCAPEHQIKQFCQSGPAISMYMECYANTEGFWKFSSPHMDQIKLFRRNLNNALNSTAEYVWIYYDAKAKWFPFDMDPRYEAILKKNGNGKAMLWRDYLPGLEDAFAAAMDPLTYAREKVAQGKAETIIKSDFEDHRLTLSTWSSGNKGKFGIDNTHGYKSKSSAFLKGVTFGSIHKRIPGKAGELYYLRAKGKDLSGKSRMTMGYQFAPNRDITIPLSNVDNDGWGTAESVFFAPENAEELLFSCGVWTSDPNGSDCVFDDFEVYRID